ncbi:MAG: phosphoribosylformylglycinamidine synthase subunit PurL [Saprospiraceae bacterium]|nr:phosphoribosylformylglycinamidine synthase subunit PurL [Saprospiraceae bacterium]MDW8229012.1 phosphoribosylformylglycinamidine synthase subunit PurL [Saprospiraceae bacterium]
MVTAEPLPTVDTARSLGLLPEEFEKIGQILGRVPNFTELSLYSVMWSEHCSYKNSILQLKTLPRSGGRLLVSAGEENAGLVDIGDGLACAFKIESHNHPSAIEPYQGAATGVGGIHRDIFTMGARPIAALNSLRFGKPDNPRMKRLIAGVVKGIGDYGNCFGVPTVGGEVYFYDCYHHDILVNAMSIGIVRVGETVSATAGGPGNPVFIVGSATGKDGIHGATFASADLTEDSHEDLPAVQVGDPFQEKLLLEATLEAIKTGAIVGMQDMGAAGIACSTSEMSARAGCGMRIDLDKVPQRQANMKAWEILLSESQERMLIVCKPGQEDVLKAVFDKWDLPCERIGETTAGGLLEYFWHGEKVAEVPAQSLVLGGGAPVYVREQREPEYLMDIARFRLEDVPEPADLRQAAQTLWASPNIASKRWITRQYDSMVRTGTMTTNRPADAAVVYVKGTRKALAMTTDCNSAYVYADPYRGAMIAVCEAARNITCAGGEPVAITNCLNFGNPYNPEVYYQFAQAIRGMGDACRKLNTPVTGGNVSFYNQYTENGKVIPVYPTPTIGMLGILDDWEQLMTLDFKAEGDRIYLLGVSRNDLGSSEYLREVHRVDYSPCPHFEIEEEYHLLSVLRRLIRERLVQSAHDVSDGGLFVALMESAMPRGLGFVVSSPSGIRRDAWLFGEAQSRVVVSVAPKQAEAFERFLDEHKQPFERLGQVQGNRVRIDGEDWGAIREWQDVYEQRLAEIMA